MLGLLIMTALQFGSIDVSSAGVVDRPAAQRFSYDAAAEQDRRKTPKVLRGYEDRILDVGKRDKLIANARDLNRNFSTAAWAIRQHLNYVATFRFHARNKDKGLNRAVEDLVRMWSRPYACDVAGRHRLSRFIRLAEIRRILDGDVGVMKLSSGQLQGIEGDLIRNPIGNFSGRWIHGVKLNDGNRALAYALHRRSDYGSLEFDRTVPGSNLFLHGCYDRFDQIRGVSPLASSLNQFRDVYENFNYALAKAKVHQLFALAFYRNAETAAGVLEDDAYANNEEEGETETSSTEPRYRVDFGAGPALLDLDPGDRAEFLESTSPSSEFQSFTQLVTMVALKALDVPYSFFDEAHTNFFGSRGAWLHYDRSCDEKREDLQDLLRWITIWRMQLWVMDGDLQLPSGMEFKDLAWEWVPAGMPWWDPVKEIAGDSNAVAAGFDNPYRIVKERDRGDFESNIDATAEACAYARSKGVILKYDLFGQQQLKAGSAGSSSATSDGTDANADA
jgi:capsid protein